MSSLCRLSANSQYCLSQQLSLGTQNPAEGTDCASTCNASDLDSLSQISDSKRRNEQSSKGRNRNVNFMLSMLKICRKMIMPIAALQEERGDASDDVNGDCKGALFAALPPPPPVVHAVRQTNQHQLTEVRSAAASRGYSSSSGRFFWWNNASSGGEGPQSKKPSTPPQQPVASTTAKESPRCCYSEENSKELPLLRHFGAPHRNKVDYLNFRHNVASQVYEPLHDPVRHRHMLLLDSHRALRIALPGFQSPVYRPY